MQENFALSMDRWNKPSTDKQKHHSDELIQTLTRGAQKN